MKISIGINNTANAYEELRQDPRGVCISSVPSMNRVCIKSHNRRAGVTCISINLCSPARQCCLVSGHSSAVSQLLRNSVRFSAVTSYRQRPCTDCCKIYLSRRESNANKCECQGRRHRTALWLSRLVGHWHYKRLQAIYRCKFHMLQFNTVTPLWTWRGEFLNLAYPRPILSKFYFILTLLTYCELKLVPLQSGYDVTHLSSDRCYTPKIYIYI